MSKGLLLLGGAGLVAYLTRDSWLTSVENLLPGQAAPTASGITGNNPAGPITSNSNYPVSSSVPGSVPVGTQGCYAYPTGTSGSMVTNCPPGVNPPNPSAPANNCQAGFTLDASGVCTKYSDGQLLASLNSIQWTGDIPAEQISRIDPQILEMYSATTGVNAGTVLAYMLGLGANPADGTMMPGTDGYIYKALGGVFYRQGTQTLQTAPPTNPSARKYYLQGVGGGRMGSVTTFSTALPITQDILIRASADPQIAKIVGRDQRAMLTATQWNSYYTQATGIPQGIPLNPYAMHGALMSAEQYQARRKAAGLMTMAANLGTLRPARRGAFPLGRIGLINQWVPPQNRTIYNVPGRGAVISVQNKIPSNKLERQRGHLGLITDGGGAHRWARSPFPRPAWWREAE